MDPDKKISFGFSKFSKKPQVLLTKPVAEKKVELIESLEGNTIKIKDAVEVIDEPLVIPIKDNKRNLLDRIRDAKNKQEKLKQAIDNNEDTRPDSELTLDELAARELINDAKKRLEQKNEPGKVFVLPMKEEKIEEGEAEPTLQDYEDIPISDYGMAMLRGMGWKEGMGIGKNQKKSGELAKAPELRPKGLGLGANKMVKADMPQDKLVDKDEKELVLKKGAFAKIIAGAKQGNYCEVQGLDDEAGRVIVKTTIKGEILTLNEFLVIPVTKEEYAKCSKVLNAAKYEEYKDRGINNGSNHKDNNRPSSSRNKDDSSAHDIKSERKHERKIKDEPPPPPRNDNGKSSKYADVKKELPDDYSSSDDDCDDDDDEDDDHDRRHKNNRQRRKDDGRKEPETSDSDHERRRRHHHHKKKDKRSRRDRSRSHKKKKKKSKRHSSDGDSPDSAYEECCSRSMSRKRRSRSRDGKHGRSKRYV